MKVYFNTGQYEGCNYVRCLLPLIHLGADGDYTSLASQKVSSKQAGAGMLDADIVVMQRPFEEQRKVIFNALKESGKVLIFDNDDTYIDKSQAFGVEKLAENMDESLKWFAKNSDLVTVTTDFLAEEYKKVNPNVVVLPNCVDPDDYPEPKRNKTKKIRVGLIGSVVGTNDFDHIKDTLKIISQREDIQIVVMSTKPNDGNFFDKIPVEWHNPVKIKDYFEALNDLELDMMLIPRRESYFNKCKSNIKFLEASMLEIPCITDDWKDNPYTADAEYLVMTNNWLKDIYELAGDKELRKMIGKRAHKYVLSKYDIKDNIKLWEQAYQSLII